MQRGLTILLMLGVGLLCAACDRRADSIRAQLSPEDVERFNAGARIASECWTCHEFYTRNHKVGPGLLGLMGRPAGGLSGFGYSDALRDSGIVWDRRFLSAFLADPQRVVPGNRMVSRGVSGPASLDAITFWIELVSDESLEP
jgi:cytochrome c